jgi:hypothetical protein
MGGYPFMGGTGPYGGSYDSMGAPQVALAGSFFKDGGEV